MEVTKGKLKNTKTGKEIAFAANPAQYELSQNYDFAIETQLAKPAPLVAFRCGGAATLKFGLSFERDMGLAEDALKSVQAFLADLNQIDEETASVSPVEFKMGSLAFRGYVRGFRWTASRFDPKGDVMGGKLDMELVSDGTYEKGAK
jgi:hypothetical protein